MDTDLLLPQLVFAQFAVEIAFADAKDPRRLLAVVIGERQRVFDRPFLDLFQRLTHQRRSHRIS